MVLREAISISLEHQVLALEHQVLALEDLVFAVEVEQVVCHDVEVQASYSWVVDAYPEEVEDHEAVVGTCLEVA